MKTKFIYTLLFLLLLSANSYSQLTFSVSPGIGLNSIYAGYRIDNKIVPFFGFQYLHAGLNYEETGEDYDYDLNEVVEYSYTTKFSGNLFIPNIGVKYFLKPLNKIQPYLTICLSKPFLTAKFEDDGEADVDLEDAVKNISMWGTEFGAGIEYFFDENFSLGGEFGLRYLHLKYKDTFDSDFYNPETGEYQETEIEESFKYNVSPTFTKIALSFYF